MRCCISQAQIEARALTKTFRVPKRGSGVTGAIQHLFAPVYEDKRALDQVTFDIASGEAVACVGPNGAGKSTTVKLMVGITMPTSGSVRIEGLDPHKERITNSRKIGVVFGQRSQLWWDLPVAESLRLLGDIYEIPPDRYDQTLKTCTELLELGPLLGQASRSLSLGQRMRCDIAASLLHSPRILFLDEPTIGLDVAVKARIRQFISAMNRERGVTVVLTSHDLQDIETICQRIILMDKGAIVFDGSLLAVKRQFDRSRVVTFRLREMVPDAAARVQIALSEVAPPPVITVTGYDTVVTFDPSHSSSAAVVAKVMAELPVEDLKIEEPGIESIIRQLYDGTLKLGVAEPVT